MSLLALTHHGGIRIAEVGFLLQAVAGAVFASRAFTRIGRGTANLVGGACLALGAVLLIVATHWGRFG
jgi:hypothetical protein